MRECGRCSNCCKHFEVPWLHKPAGVWCEHARPGAQAGCAIYDERPDQCRQFKCVWLQADAEQWDGDDPPVDWTHVWTDDLRPDRCHVIFTYTGPPLNCLVAVLDQHREEAWRKAPAWPLIRAAIRNYGHLLLLRPWLPEDGPRWRVLARDAFRRQTVLDMLKGVRSTPDFSSSGLTPLRRPVGSSERG